MKSQGIVHIHSSDLQIRCQNHCRVVNCRKKMRSRDEALGVAFQEAQRRVDGIAGNLRITSSCITFLHQDLCHFLARRQVLSFKVVKPRPLRYILLYTIYTDITTAKEGQSFASKHVHMSTHSTVCLPRNFSRLPSFLFGGCLKWITCADYEHEKLQARHWMVARWIRDAGFMSCAFMCFFWWHMFWSYSEECFVDTAGWRAPSRIYMYVCNIMFVFGFIYVLFWDIPNAVPGNYVFIHVLPHCVTVGCWSHI